MTSENNDSVKRGHETGSGDKKEMDEGCEWENLHMKKSFDIEGKVTVYTVDGNGDVTSVTGPDGKTVTYIRGNCCGSVDTLVDAAGNMTHWKHDVLGRTTEKWLKWDLSNPGGGGAVRVQLLTYDAVEKQRDSPEWHVDKPSQFAGA